MDMQYQQMIFSVRAALARKGKYFFFQVVVSVVDLPETLSH